MVQMRVADQNRPDAGLADGRAQGVEMGGQVRAGVQYTQTIAFTDPGAQTFVPAGTLALSATGGASGNPIVQRHFDFHGRSMIVEAHPLFREQLKAMSR